jgi:uncharacterized metal-binding protein
MLGHSIHLFQQRLLYPATKQHSHGTTVAFSCAGSSPFGGCDARFAEALPKTRSGKIMRRLLKQIAAGVEVKGDTTTLEDLGVLAKLSQAEE